MLSRPTDWLDCKYSMRVYSRIDLAGLKCPLRVSLPCLLMALVRPSGRRPPATPDLADLGGAAGVATREAMSAQSVYGAHHLGTVWTRSWRSSGPAVAFHQTEQAWMCRRSRSFEREREAPGEGGRWREVGGAEVVPKGRATVEVRPNARRCTSTTAVIFGSALRPSGRSVPRECDVRQLSTRRDRRFGR